MRFEVPVVSDAVIADLHEQLLQRESVLATAEALDGGLEFQVHSILAETFSLLGDDDVESPLVAVEYSDLEV